MADVSCSVGDAVSSPLYTLAGATAAAQRRGVLKVNIAVCLSSVVLSRHRPYWNCQSDIKGNDNIRCNVIDAQELNNTVTSNQPVVAPVFGYSNDRTVHTLL